MADPVQTDACTRCTEKRQANGKACVGCKDRAGTGTGIAGAADYVPATSRRDAVCHHCGHPAEAHHKGRWWAKAVPGIGAAQAFSDECAAAVGWIAAARKPAGPVVFAQAG